MIFVLLKDVFYRDQFTSTSSHSFDRDRYFLGLFLLVTFYIHNFWLSTVLIGSGEHDVVQSAWTETLFSVAHVLPNEYNSFFGLALLTFLLVKRMFGVWLALPVTALNLVAFSQISYVGVELLQGLTQKNQTYPISLISLVVCILLNLYIWKTRPTLKDKQPEHPLLSINNDVEHPHQMTAYWYLNKAVMSTLCLFVLVTLMYFLVGMTTILTKAHSVQGIQYLTCSLFIVLLLSMLRFAPRRYANLLSSAQLWVKRGALFWLISISIIMLCKWVLGVDFWYLSMYLLLQISSLVFFIVVMVMVLLTPSSVNHMTVTSESQTVG